MMKNIQPNPAIERISDEVIALGDAITTCTITHPDHHVDYLSDPGGTGLQHGEYTPDIIAGLFTTVEPTLSEQAASSFATAANQNLIDTANKAIVELQGVPTDYTSFSRNLYDDELRDRMRLTTGYTGLPKRGKADWRRTTHSVDSPSGTATLHTTSTTLDRPGWVERAEMHALETLTDVHHTVAITALGGVIANATVELTPLEDSLTMRLRQIMRTSDTYSRVVEPILRGAFRSDRALAGHLLVIEETHEEDLTEEDLHKLHARAIAMKEAMQHFPKQDFGSPVPPSELLTALTVQLTRLHAVAPASSTLKT